MDCISALYQPIVDLTHNNEEVPEWQQEAVADDDAEAPQHAEPQADVPEVVVAAREQVPALQLLGRETLRHLVVYDALHAAAAKVEDVGHFKLWL